MLQRRDLLLAGSETFKKPSLLGAPFEPKVSITVPMHITNTSQYLVVEPVSRTIFTWEGAGYQIERLLGGSPSAAGEIQFGWLGQIFRLGQSGVLGPCCTIYVMRKDTGAIWAFMPQLAYVPESTAWSRPTRWIYPNGMQIGIPINDACYDGAPVDKNNKLTTKDFFTEEDKGKTIECIFEIYSEYINDRPKPTEPQKYQFYFRWPLSYPDSDDEEISEGFGGWNHPFNNSVVPGVFSRYDTRIAFDDLCCFTFWPSGNYTQPLLNFWVNWMGSTGIIFWGPTCRPWLGGTSLPVAHAILYRGDDPSVTYGISLAHQYSQTGEPLYESYTTKPPPNKFNLKKSDLDTVIDLYFQYLNSTDS